ncbi:MAG: imelysin family protein [Bacteroidota bacterium]
MRIYKKTRAEKNFVFSILALFFFAALTSCKDDDESGNGGESPPPEVTFDRSVFLEDMATELIIPNFEALENSTDSLALATENFTTDATEENLAVLREAWVEAVTDYQHCSAFGFGPGDLTLGPFASVLGVFPVDEFEVEQNINDENFDLVNTFSRDIRGFYTVEYLIYGKGETDAELISAFDQERKDYLTLIVDELDETFKSIVDEWNTSYLDEFISNDGTSSGSPTSLLYNEFVKDYENMKNFKVELPAGLTAGQETVDPTLVEAYYSGISTELIEHNFENSKNIWYGRTRDGEDIEGFQEYLDSVEGGPDLIVTTIAAIARIDDAIAAVPEGKLSDHVETDEVETLRNELQDNTANFKSSMSSLLGINITFNSGDGD